MASSISSKTRECLKLFAQLAEAAKEPPLGDEHDRFDKWSRNIGAHQKGSSSLDQRLQDASHIRDVVVELLDGLIDSLSQVVELSKVELDETKNSKSSESESELTQDELRDSIHIMISSLLKLAIAVRDPAPVDRYIKSRAIDMSFYKAHDLAYLEELFPGIDEYLKERMAEATLQRRRFLEYSARHHFKLARDSSPEETEEEGDDTASLYAETNASSLPAPLRRESSTLEATFDTRSERSSFTSYASSGMGTRPKVPPPPPDAVLGGDPFECPYCHLLISPHDTPNWKKHVFHDLQPYVCTFEKCEDPDRLYRSRHEWFDHELAMHRREWVCPGHCDKIFSSREPFEDHLAANYSESVGASLSTLIKTCERPNLPSASVHCPFCLENVASRKKIRHHIGQHLAGISLRVLPTSVEENEYSENEVHDESADSGPERTASKEEIARTSLDAAVEDLELRITNLGHNRESFGKLLLHGKYDVAKKEAAVLRNYEVYVFEKILIYCKLKPGPVKKRTKRWYRRDKDKDKPSEDEKPVLLLEGRIFMTKIANTVAFPDKLQVSWWQGNTIESFILHLKDKKKVQVWKAAIDSQVELGGSKHVASGFSSALGPRDTPDTNPRPIGDSEGDTQDGDSTNFRGNEIQPFPLQPLSSPHLKAAYDEHFRANVEYAGNIIHVVIHTSESYQTLIDRIKAKMGPLHSPLLSPFISEPLKLRWRDKDGDLVVISNDDDLQLAIAEDLQRPPRETGVREMNFTYMSSQQETFPSGMLDSDIPTLGLPPGILRRNSSSPGPMQLSNLPGIASSKPQLGREAS